MYIPLHIDHPLIQGVRTCSEYLKKKIIVARIRASLMFCDAHDSLSFSGRSIIMRVLEHVPGVRVCAGCSNIFWVFEHDRLFENNGY